MSPKNRILVIWKIEIKDKIIGCITYDDWIDYYNNDRCIWHLNKMPPLEFYKSVKNKKIHLFPRGRPETKRVFY